MLFSHFDVVLRTYITNVERKKFIAHFNRPHIRRTILSLYDLQNRYFAYLYWYNVCVILVCNNKNLKTVFVRTFCPHFIFYFFTFIRFFVTCAQDAYFFYVKSTLYFWSRIEIKSKNIKKETSSYIYIYKFYCFLFSTCKHIVYNRKEIIPIV